MTDIALVSTEWLAAHLDGVILLDASFKLPGATPTAAEEYATRHIPGARFFDIDTVADHANPLPHMLPSELDFAGIIGAMGVSNDSHVVIYDTPGLMSAGRAWWTLRVFGHRRVSVLNGGLRKWLAEGRPVTEALPDVTSAQFTAQLDGSMVRSKAQMLANLDSHAEQVIDARSAGRFTAEEKEARPGLRSGHIPGSFNLPFNALTDPATGELRDPAALRRAFTEAGLDLDAPVAATCGSGVTAAALAFGLHLIGKDDVAVYDGSWTEWGQPGDTPVATGPRDA